LDITDAIVRVSKLEFRGATGFDTILNNVARNTILLVDQNVEYVADKAWGLKLPNAWISEFEAYWASGASGNIDFNIYNNTTSGTNGYTISMDDTTITVKYDGGSALETVSLGSTLRNDTWRKIHILFERDMISLAIDGTPVLYFKDTLLRPRVYDEDSGYVVASGLSANRKVKNIRILNGDKWMTDNTSNIAFVHGNVGIGTTQAAYTLDVDGDIRATGNLLIEGLTTTVDTQNLSIEDAIVEIGRGNDGGTSGKDVGFLFTRNNGADTTNSNVALIYDESTDRLTFGYSDGSPTDSTLAINTSKSLDVVIPSGNLGVGTASPLSTVDISSTTGLILRNTAIKTAVDDRVGYIEFHNGSAVSGNMSSAIEACVNVGGVNNNTDLRFKTTFDYNNPLVERMRIDRAGNVGIGKTNPISRLDVSDLSNSKTTPTLTLNHNGVFDYASPNPSVWQSIDFTTEAGGTRTRQCGINLLNYSSAGSGQNGIADRMRTGLGFSVHNENGMVENALVINKDGNVGIGTDSPGYKLHVVGGPTKSDGFVLGTANNSYTPGCIYTDYNWGMLFRSAVSSPEIADFVFNSYAGTNMMVIKDGNVGIGTTNPTSSLQISAPIISGENAAVLTLHNTHNIYDRGRALIKAEHDGIESAGNKLTFWTRLDTAASYDGTAYVSERMCIKNDGSVGIGTDSPGHKLHVYGNAAGIDLGPVAAMGFVDGNISFCGIKVGQKVSSPFSRTALSVEDNGTTILHVDGWNRRVGIGTVSPGAPLAVVSTRNADTWAADKSQLDVLNDNGSGSTYGMSLAVSQTHGDGIIQTFNRSNGIAQYDLRLQPNAGNVGIGTTSPKSKLDVYQGAGTVFGGTTATLADSPGLTLSSSGSKWGIFINSNSDLIFVGKSGATGYYTGVAGFVVSGARDVRMNFTGQHRTFIKDIPFTRAEELEGLIVSADNNTYIKMSGGIEAGSNAITTNESLPVVSLSTKVNDKKCFGVISSSENPETREDAYGSFVTPYDKELGDTRVYINSVGEGAMWVVNTAGPLESGDYITTSNVAGYGQGQDDDVLHNYTVAKITMDCDFNPETQPLQIIKKELANVNYWVKTTVSNVSVEEYSNLAVDMRTSTTETYYSNEDGEIGVTEYSNLESNVQSTYTELTRTVYQKISKEELKTETEGYDIEIREELVNVLDEHGQLQWEDHPTETEKAYKIRYLDATGVQTDEANAVHIAAFVGVTYHCG
jgi:hypothetical protein